MPLVQKLINSNEYYTDGRVYYTFHQVKTSTDTLWNFACMDLGITGKTYLTSQETKNITDLAGIGPHHPTRFLLLKNGDAIPIPYLPNGSADLKPNDIILRSAVAPDASEPAAAVVFSASTKSVADRLKEIEDLRTMKVLTDLEYQDKRAEIIAEL